MALTKWFKIRIIAGNHSWITNTLKILLRCPSGTLSLTVAQESQTVEINVDDSSGTVFKFDPGQSTNPDVCPIENYTFLEDPNSWIGHPELTFSDVDGQLFITPIDPLAAKTYNFYIRAFSGDISFTTAN